MLLKWSIFEVIFKVELSNISWLQFLTYQDLLLFFFIYEWSSKK